MARAATETQRAGLTGLEFGLAIPGTVGGAVWANAGAHESDVAGVLESARVLARRRHRERSCRRRSSASPIATAGSSTAPRTPAPPRDVVVDATFRLEPGRPRHDQGAPRRHPPLAPGPPAARAAVGRQRVPQPGRRLGRPADRGGRAQGPADRRRGRVREARQLHRQRPEGHREPTSAAWPSASAPRSRARHGVELAFEIEFVGDWSGWEASRVTSSTARRSSSCSAGRRPSTTCRSCPGRRSPTRSRTRGHAVEQVLIDLDGGWWWLPADHRRGRTGRPPPTTTRPRSGADGPIAAGAGARPAGRRAAGAGRVHRPARPVRRGRHGPGPARGGRPGLHRVRRRGVGDRHGQGALQAAVPRASGCRSSTGARSAPRAGRPTRDARPGRARGLRRRQPATRG